MLELGREFFEEVVIYGQYNINENLKEASRKFEKSMRVKIIRWALQIDFFRFLARNTPLFIKDLFSRPLKEPTKITDYRIDQKQIEQSYILFLEGYKKKEN